ncbi:helix-turn-helix transcriptional regulator [Bacillus alkalicellulosilyticus]|uniref:helix-turn-helix transcriptional regulator n=1 Tax=Alkalihalobacterium alkalicellulosilyticum TaxID=1912214 RepID=UPI0009981CE5|nr:helix-turn-helix transcriptional regulator [Bacillus alkalicellulosilyticus]
MSQIELTERQERILEMVKSTGPISGEQIAENTQIPKATLRTDLAILTMAGFLDARPKVGYFYTGKKRSQQLVDKMKEVKVEQYLSPPVLISDGASVYDAVCMMFLEDVGTLFICDKEKMLKGVLSRKDLLRATIGNQQLEKLPINIIMTRMPNIEMCKPENTMLEVAETLLSIQVDALPVVREFNLGGYEVIGRVSKTNITKVFVDLAKIDL